MSEIKFSQVLSPPRHGEPNVAYLTVEEFDHLVELIEASPEIVEDLMTHSNLVNEWRRSNDPLVETWLPESVPKIRELLLTVSARDNTTILCVRVYSEYMKIKGWIS